MFNPVGLMDTAAVRRYVQSYAAQIFNVKSFGALGDGTTDDAAAIAAAIAAAGTGNTVYFPKGTYRQSAACAPLAGQTLLGIGGDGSILLAPTSGGANAVSVAVSDVTLHGLLVDGQRAAQIAAGNNTQSNNNYCGIYVTGARCLIDRCHVKNTRNVGIMADSGGAGDDLVVTDCFVENLGISTSVTGWFYYGILILGRQRAKLIRNIVQGYAQGIGIWYGASDCLVFANTLLNNYGWLDDAHAALPRSAIEEYGATTGACHDNKFDFNIVDGSNSNCFEIAQGNTRSVYYGNTLRNGAGGLIGVTGDDGGNTTDITIQANTLTGTGTAADRRAIQVVGKAFNILIDSNILTNFSDPASEAAIFVGGTHVYGAVTISKNVIRNCYRGVWLNDNEDGISVLDNTILAGASTSYGIWIISGDKHLIRGNRIDCALGGRCLYVNTSDNRILGNTCNAQTMCFYIQGVTPVILENSLVTLNFSNEGAVFLDGTIGPVIRLNYVNGGDNYAIKSGADVTFAIVQENMIISTQATPITVSGVLLQLEPNHSGSGLRSSVPKSLGSHTVGTTPVTVAHGLGYTPIVCLIEMTSAGQVWRSAASDATNVTLTADAAGRTCEIFVR